jgi:lipopolysaccharide export system protein LptA
MTESRLCPGHRLRMPRILLACLVLGAVPAWALPEDAQQPIEMDWSDSEISLDDGLMILYGTAAEPATIRQGSMQISGSEIRIERSGEVVTRVTTTGTPARFQQQLEADQDPLTASGLTIVFNNDLQTLTIDERVEVMHAGTRTEAHHFEYDFATRRFRSSRDPDGEPVRMLVPPAAQQ